MFRWFMQIGIYEKRYHYAKWGVIKYENVVKDIECLYNITNDTGFEFQTMQLKNIT